ncbi:hypothetical protein [Rhizobium johnstonii]|uniref:hypothetical protein n=1 Tax=Rhizobium johnstonii TaxID=3019933 RepID=UPI003F96C7CA
MSNEPVTYTHGHCQPCAITFPSRPFWELRLLTAIRQLQLENGGLPMTEREQPDRDLGELLAILRRGHTEPMPTSYYYGFEPEEVTNTLEDIANSAAPAPTSDVPSGLAESVDAARLHPLADDEDSSDIDESEWETIPWSPSSAYDPNDAFEEYRDFLRTRAPEDVEDLLVLFCSSQFVRVSRGRISKIEDLNIFVWAVLINAPVIARRRPLAWTEKELEKIVAVMLRHRA